MQCFEGKENGNFSRNYSRKAPTEWDSRKVRVII
jgi:hypothetical protein